MDLHKFAVLRKTFWKELENKKNERERKREREGKGGKTQ